MPVSRRRYDDLHARYQALVEKTKDEARNREQTAGGTAMVAARYDRLAAVVAVHIVTAEDHDTDIHPSVLRKAVAQAGIDLAVEYDRANREGARS